MSRRTVRLSRLLVSAIVFATASSGMAAAAGSMWTEGSGSRTFTLSGDVCAAGPAEDQAVSLPYTVLWRSAGAGVRSARPIGEGRFLVCDGSKVFEAGPSATSWTFTRTDDASLAVPVDARMLPDGRVLVVDRGDDRTPGRVLVVSHADDTGKVLWSYGGERGTGAGQLERPASACQTADGAVMIADEGSGRIIRVRPDLAARAGGAIEWQRAGLSRPTSVQELSEPQRIRYLVTERTARRIVEIDAASGRTGWSYAALDDPVTAERLADGRTLIVDVGPAGGDPSGARLIEVDQAGAVRASYPAAGAAGTVVTPGSATRLADGTTLVADAGADRLFTYGHALAGSGTSARIDCGAPGVLKRFTRAVWSATLPEGTSASLEYRIDGRSWVRAANGANLPATAQGTYIEYRVTLSTSAFGVSPVLEDVSFEWHVAPTTSGGGSTGRRGSSGPRTGRSWGGGSGTGTGGWLGFGSQGPAAGGATGGGSASVPGSGVGTSAMDITPLDRGPQLLSGRVMVRSTTMTGAFPSDGERVGLRGLGITGTSQAAGLALLAAVFTVGVGSGPVGGWIRLAARAVGLVGR